MKIRHLPIFLSILFFAVSVFAQSETLTNSHIVEMSKIGLDKQIILKKINDSPNNFDVSVNGLIELKKAGVDEEVIALMMEKAPTQRERYSNSQTVAAVTNNAQNYSDSVPVDNQTSQNLRSPKESLLTARTIAIEKSSINPSRQALEKELLKRKEWKKFNLSIVRYKEGADLYIEIGFVHFSIITHRYVFRIYDRRNNTVLAAGETTSWGSLAENLARDIAKKLDAVLTK